MSPSLLFKPKKTLEVKGYILVFFISVFCLGQSELPSADIPQERYKNLPDIEAKAYAAKVVRLSKSKRVYLFVLNQDQPLPEDRKIILLKKGNTNVMAFRVIKQYLDGNQIAARRVRSYPNYEQLGKGRAFLAYEKVADLIGIEDDTEEDLALDQEDLGEIEETMPEAKQGDDVFFDDFGEDESTAGEDPLNDEAIEDDFFTEEDDTAKAAPVEEYGEDFGDEEGFEEYGEEEPIEEEGPTDAGGADEFAEESAPKEEEVDLSDITVDRITATEEKFFDRHNNDLTLGTGLFNAPNSSTGGVAFRIGFGIQYGFNMGRKIFATSNNTQDSFTLEAGLYTYKVLNFLSAGDSYTVFPLFAKLRYNLMFSPSFWLYAQGGLLKNGVLAGARGSASETEFNNAIASLGRFVPVIGIGTMVQMGPHWYVRVDAGFDSINVGVTLRF